MSVTVRGLDELIGTLDSAGADARPIIRRGLRAGAKVLQAAIAERAPERTPGSGHSDALPPGALRRDIVIHSGEDDGNIAMIVGPDKLTRHVAGWVEYGHRETRGRHGRATGQVPAHPFIRPAFEASAEAAEAAFAATVARAITRKFGDHT